MVVTPEESCLPLLVHHHHQELLLPAGWTRAERLHCFLESSGVQRPVMGVVEGGVRVPYLREEDVAGQGRIGSVCA